MKKQTKKTTAAVVKSSAAELTKRLGPIRKVVRLVRARDTKASFNLHLECRHVRVGTKRATLRCRRCAK